MGCAAQPELRLEPANVPGAHVVLVGLSEASLRSAAAMTDRKRGRLLRVMVDGPGKVPAMLGDVEVAEDVVRFRPRFPFQRGTKYRALAQWRTPEGRSVAVDLWFTVPRDVLTPRTRVTAVYPSSPTLPENLLKFYIHFSGPMRHGDAYVHLALLDERGRKIDLPFLELPQELWNRESTRLTVLFDPGRIKRGLKPRREAGAVFVPGERYRFVISGPWLDTKGRPIAEKFEKKFVISSSDRTQPDPKRWRLTLPRSGTSQPLQVQFNESLDHGLAHRVIDVQRKDGSSMPGSIHVQSNEQQWLFTPATPWQTADYKLVVRPELEDLAGNSVGRPFEVDLDQPAVEDRSKVSVQIPFSLK
jgi:hypothetical protein